MNITQPTPLEFIYQSLPALNVKELDDLMTQVIHLRQQKLPNVLPLLETELLRKINAKIPSTIQTRYNVLFKKRHKETLTESEYSELLELNSYMEQHSVQRLELLIELAKIRNKTLDQILQELEIKPKLNVA